jgi:hypothetical protein
MPDPESPLFDLAHALISAAIITALIYWGLPAVILTVIVAALIVARA